MEENTGQKRNHDAAMSGEHNFAHLSDEAIENEIQKITGMAVDSAEGSAPPDHNSDSGANEPPAKRMAKDVRPSKPVRGFAHRI